MKQAARKPHHCQAADVRQPWPVPSSFSGMPPDACQLVTPIDPEDLANLKVIDLAFVTQSATDICREIQKTDGFAGKNRSERLEIARKVFGSRGSKDNLSSEKTG